MGNFWQSIKTGFQKGWQNGNIAKITKAVGTTAFTVGYTGMAIREMNKPSCNNSIFGGGFGCGCNNGFGNWMQYDPMGFTGWMGQQDCSTNPYLTNMGLMSAYQSGQQMMMQMMAQSPQSNYSQYYQQFQQFQQQFGNQGSLSFAPKRSNKDADAVGSDTDKKAGEDYHEATNKLIKSDGKQNTEASDVKIADNSSQEAYTNSISELSKSYLASMDKDGDGYVSEKEYVEHATEDIVDENDKKKQEAIAKVVFQKFDLNQGGKIDWKELAAGLTTLDGGGVANKKQKLDGKITAQEMSDAQTIAMTNSTTFASANWYNYEQLFGKSDE